MLMVNVDAHSLGTLLEAEMELLNKLKVDEAKYYTDGSAESEEDDRP